ncbi:MAG TPA: diacylglycerol kinase family protein [Kofleriaceae bacterium]
MRAVAIVNGAARRLGRRLRAKLEHALPGNVCFTSSLDDARSTIRREIRRGVDLMIFGGGDGTVVMGLTLLGEACRAHARREPAIGVLRLGSGNAIADTLGAGRDVAEDLERLARGGGTRRELPLLEVLGVRAPFVGVGIDAQVLEDHAAVGELVDRMPCARAVGGGARYVLSVALRSIPRFAFGARAHAIVTNAGAPALELAESGATKREHAAGAELWRGTCTMVAGATIPYFGFGLKMFAFAGTRGDRFQLRCADPGFAEVMRAVRPAFRGEYFSERVHDFWCDRVAIKLDRETAIEAGGELLGRRDRVELALGKSVTALVLA